MGMALVGSSAIHINDMRLRIVVGATAITMMRIQFIRARTRSCVLPWPVPIDIRETCVMLYVCHLCSFYLRGPRVFVLGHSRMSKK